MRGISNLYMDEHEMLKLLDEHDPNQTVYFTGFQMTNLKNYIEKLLKICFPVTLLENPKHILILQSKGKILYV